ncbi:hypothetical protein KEM54_003305, partial [Ascosphaera aggregata]
MFLKLVDLTTALRPVLLPDETLHFVQDAVGLYQCRDKIPDRQNGHAYLTSHRICYVDSENPRKCSLAIDLRNVERAEIQAGFLRSSPKITIYQKKSRKRRSVVSAAPTARAVTATAQSAGTLLTLAINATWICTICSFANPVPSNFNPETANASATPLPPCLACGIKPSFATVLKAAIAARSETLVDSSRYAEFGASSLGKTIGSQLGNSADSDKLICPRCTFENHASILFCEICGASLRPIPGSSGHNVPTAVEQHQLPDFGPTDFLKLSFRSGGDKTFYERLKNALIQRKWLVASAPPVPKPSTEAAISTPPRNGSPKWDE